MWSKLLCFICYILQFKCDHIEIIYFICEFPIPHNAAYYGPKWMMFSNIFCVWKYPHSIMTLLCNFINSINLYKPYDYCIGDYCFKFYIAVSVSTAQIIFTHPTGKSPLSFTGPAKVLPLARQNRSFIYMYMVQVFKYSPRLLTAHGWYLIICEDHLIVIGTIAKG